ncbi:hypothetical protein BT96DRAFT_877009 [Gymnopus androsaceus JB14]|uniref:Arrestin-like N-terminal domain-containing protein n=1 Tax=Gymnopus androsaceus JB14 TaxID=1447944 RepID=A0A6A4I5L8_9AGAR|nr:hypothetical protein BT96DRAFT_877009 [Gymnopus androsaceus JB14]
MELPPVYDANDASFERNADALPAYSSSIGRAIPTSALNLTESSNGAASKEFTYDLKSKSSLASLVLYGDHLLSKQLPTFLEGSKVEGLVKLNLESGESINAVVISIRGQVVSGSTIYTFLDCSQTLWPQPTSNGQKSNDKLQGEQEWPFSIHIPKEVALTLGTKDAPRVEVFRLPHTFLERHARASIQYEVVLRLARGFMKTDHRIITPFGYIPISRPEAPSRLRQLAYQENTPVPGPISDPEGWYTLTPIQIHGKLFNRQSIDATCTLSLASPLSYTRGSIIPLHLVIQSHNIQALETLSAPQAIICRLRRNIRYRPEENKASDPYLRRDEVDHSELATWWAYNEGPPPEKETFKRTMGGEILLPSDLKPTTNMGRFRLEYSIVFFPFDANGFQGEINSSDPMSEHPVEIATAFPPGPLPRTYTPNDQAVHSSSLMVGSSLQTSGFF